MLSVIKKINTWALERTQKSILLGISEIFWLVFVFTADRKTIPLHDWTIEIPLKWRKIQREAKGMQEGWSHMFEEALVSWKFMEPEGKVLDLCPCSARPALWSSPFHCWTWVNFIYCQNGIHICSIFNFYRLAHLFLLSFSKDAWGTYCELEAVPGAEKTPGMNRTRTCLHRRLQRRSAACDESARWPYLVLEVEGGGSEEASRKKWHLS